MTRSELMDPRNILRAAGALFVAAAIAFSVMAPAEAQRRNNDEEQSAEGRVLSTRVGEAVLQIQELLDQEQWRPVITQATALLNTELTNYERSVILRIRGNTYFQVEDYAGSIRDFVAAINTGALVNDEIIGLRTNLGQLNMVVEDYAEGIRQFELAVQAGAELNAQLSRTLASAYVQAASETNSTSEARSLIERGLRYAERFYQLQATKNESEFALMQYYYQQLNRPQDELRVVRDSLQAFPGGRRGWQNLVALFAQLGREEDAFEANKLMYLNGLFEEENELVRLVQYYSFFENPFRGAIILEREINAGRVEGNQENLETLANMWRQASEFDRAIPVLRRLSDLLGDGETALRLAEAHFQENQFPQAESALETALERGGLSNTGAAWELLGNVRYEQVDDIRADRAKANEALAAFRRAAEFRSSRTAAQGWIRFINAQIDGEERRRIQRIQLIIDSCRLTFEAEKRILVLTGEVDDQGRVVIPADAFPERCEPYYDQFGDQIREAGWTDAEFEAAQAERAEAEARRLEERGEG